MAKLIGTVVDDKTAEVLNAYSAKRAEERDDPQECPMKVAAESREMAPLERVQAVCDALRSVNPQQCGDDRATEARQIVTQVDAGWSCGCAHCA